MKSRKSISLFLGLVCSCLISLSACATANTDSTTPIATSTAQVTPVQPQQPVSIDCPPQGTTRPAALASHISPAAGAVFYIAQSEGGQVPPLHPMLKRYDLNTGKTTPLLWFADPHYSIVGKQLSPDKRWIIVEVEAIDGVSSLQLIGVDGTHHQTLFCNTQQFVGDSDIQWAPDSQQVAFSQISDNGNITITAFNLVAGQQKVLANGAYTPSVWLNSRQLYAWNDGTVNSTLSTMRKLYLFDATKSANQTPVLAASSPIACGAYALSSNAQQLLTASCTVKPVSCANGTTDTKEGFSGLGSLDERNTNGGPVTSLYSQNNLGILAIQPAGPNILFYNLGKNAQTSGVWLLTPTGKATHLASDSGSACYDAEFDNNPPAIAGDASAYALLTNGDQTLEVGSINGGSPTIIATASIDKNESLALVGIA